MAESTKKKKARIEETKKADKLEFGLRKQAGRRDKARNRRRGPYRKANIY